MADSAPPPSDPKTPSEAEQSAQEMAVQAKQIQQEAEAALQSLTQQADDLLMPGPMFSLMGSEIFSYTELKQQYTKSAPLLR